MPPLANGPRSDLEKVVKKARIVAERAAEDALKTLTVHEAKASDYADRDLRARLRAHARQLGDTRKPSGEQEIGRLVHECAYEHWHRMLFARFLAENDLLIHPEHSVSVSLDDVMELAREQGIDQWELASRFAQRMLPQIFRPDDPVLAVALPREWTLELEQLLESLPAETFKADDSLGWVYQFWQAEEKDRVNASGKKITGETLPAVTQLFTEHYMVLFLLHNSIGAWHAGKVLERSPSLAQSARDEGELRRAVALKSNSVAGDVYTFEYLRFVKDKNGWRPAAGRFPGWPKVAAEFKVLDPCCGSGHFIVAAFDLLVRLRIEEEGLSVVDAVDVVLRDNLFGLEIDQRCAQITTFNLALAAWKLVGHRQLPLPNIACTGLAVGEAREQWMQTIAQHSTHDLRFFFGQLYDLFRKAPTLGSLINPNRFFGSGMLGKEGMQALLKALSAAIAEDPRATPERKELGVTAHGLAKAAELLAGPKGGGSGGYTLVITNVPYLGRGKQDEVLREHLEAQYPLGKADLATAFVLRCLEFCGSGRSAALVTPQNWLFLTGYTKMRETLLERREWNLVARLGPGAFETIGGHVVNVALLEITAREPTDNAVMAGTDVAEAATPEAKAALLRGAVTLERAGRADSSSGRHSTEGAGASMTTRAQGTTTVKGIAQSKTLPATIFEGSTDGEEDSTETAEGLKRGTDASNDDTPGAVVLLLQAEQLKNPDSRIQFSVTGTQSLLGNYASSIEGLSTGDTDRFVLSFWELHKHGAAAWEWYIQNVEETCDYGGRSEVIRWENGSGDLHLASSAHNFPAPVMNGRQILGRDGVRVTQMGPMACTLYTGEIFGKNAATVVPHDPEHLPSVYAFCRSPGYRAAVRRVDQALKVTVGSLLKVPFDLAHWRGVAAETYPDGLPEPQSNDPTQWLFHGNPAGMVAAGMASASPMNIIDPTAAERHPSLICRTPNLGAVLQVTAARLVGYRWPAEFDEKMRLDAACRAWVEKCRALDQYADDDGVVPLVPMRGEPSAEDRVRDLLRASFGGNWNSAKEGTLLAAAAAVNGDKSRAADLDDWLKNRFFYEHCSLFHHRPFVWHIWDGRKKDGFGVLVHYHRLVAPDGAGRRLLEAITHSYLGDWIARQRDELKAEKAGAEARLVAAQELQMKLEAILEGEPPYDIFVRWKPLNEQPIGWEPDINDGVRMNIRPFIEADILRDRVNVKWTKDRGKEPEKSRPMAEFPWFWDGGKFTGDRVNDIHLKNDVKHKARVHARRK